MTDLVDGILLVELLTFWLRWEASNEHLWSWRFCSSKNISVHHCWWYFWSGDVASSETSLRPRSDLQNNKDPPGGGRRSLLRRSSQSSIHMKRGDKERARESMRVEKSPCQVVLIALHTKCLFYPCQAHCPMGTSDIFSDLIWLVS